MGKCLKAEGEREGRVRGALFSFFHARRRETISLPIGFTRNHAQIKTQRKTKTKTKEEG